MPTPEQTKNNQKQIPHCSNNNHNTQCRTSKLHLIRISLNDKKYKQHVDQLSKRAQRGNGHHHRRRRKLFGFKDVDSHSIVEEDIDNHVQFSNDVIVKEIKSHKMYSDSVKNLLWNDRRTISENAYLNSIEYESEGSDWESVIEEDEMYINEKSGEHVHPIWIEIENEMVKQNERDTHNNHYER